MNLESVKSIWNKFKIPQESPETNHQVDLSRRKFLKLMGVATVGIAIGCSKSILSEDESKNIDSIEGKIEYSSKNRGYLKAMPNIGYNKGVEFPTIKNLDLVGEVSKYGVVGNKTAEISAEEARLQGSIMRGMRYKNITDAVEDRYQLPRNILFALMVEESTGGSTLLNGRDDGGAGWCHMQPSLATKFDVRTFENNKELKPGAEYGKRMREEFTVRGYEGMPDIDSRFHVLKNIDAAGRMLAYYFCGAGINRDGYRDLEPIQMAIARYSGTYNYSERYWPDIVQVSKYMKDNDFISALENEFNERNRDMTIGGKNIAKGDEFNTYFKTFWEHNSKQYGLEEYKKLQKCHLVAMSCETSANQREKFNDFALEEKTAGPFASWSK